MCHPTKAEFLSVLKDKGERRHVRAIRFLFVYPGSYLLIMNMLDDGYKTDASDEDDTSK